LHVGSRHVGGRHSAERSGMTILACLR
jgi:hypothetical protein